MRRLLLVGVVTGALAGLGCTRVNPAYCEPTMPDACPEGQVCDGAKNLCVIPDGGLPDGGGADGAVGDAGGSDGDAAPADGGDAAPDAPPECLQSSDCLDPAAPICLDHSCRPCGDSGQCLARSAENPVCDSGRCYQCLSHADCKTATAPLCSATRTCEPCGRDLDCKTGPQPSVGVCVAGACPGADAVLWVQAGATCSGADGSEAKPFCEIAAAVAAVAAGGPRVVVVRPGTTYARFTAATAGLAGLLIVGHLDGEVVVTGDATHPAADLAADVTLRRLHLKGVQAAGVPVLQCVGEPCTGEELNVEQGGIGVRASNARPLTLVRSRVHHNQGGGVSTEGSSGYRILNNFIYANGTPSSLLGGVYFDTSYETKIFVNNTVVANNAVAGTGAGVHCDALDVVVANDILWDNREGSTGTVVSAALGCTVTYSVVDDPAIAAIAGAHNVGDPPLFKSPGSPAYDFHLLDGSSALGVGDASVAPSDDIDGEPRPSSGPIDVGADQH